jgi:hypothetical protein
MGGIKEHRGGFKAAKKALQRAFFFGISELVLI